MRPPRDQVEAAVLRLDALDHPAAGLLVADRLLRRRSARSPRRGPSGRCCGRRPLGVRQHPGAAEVRDVADGAVPLHAPARAPPFEAVVQLVEVVPRPARCSPSRPGTFCALDLAVQRARRAGRLLRGRSARSRLISTCRAIGLDLARPLGRRSPPGRAAAPSRRGACSTAARSGSAASSGRRRAVGRRGQRRGRCVGWRTAIAPDCVGLDDEQPAVQRVAAAVLDRGARRRRARTGSFALEVVEDGAPPAGRRATRSSDVRRAPPRTAGGRASPIPASGPSGGAPCRRRPCRYSRPSRPKRGSSRSPMGMRRARHLADAVDVAVLAGPASGGRRRSGPACDEEVLDHLGHQPALPRLGRLADDAPRGSAPASPALPASTR